MTLASTGFQKSTFQQIVQEEMLFKEMFMDEARHIPHDERSPIAIDQLEPLAQVRL